MNACLHPFGALLMADYEYHGLTLDLYGSLDDDGYSVMRVCVPGTLIDITDAVSGNVLDWMSGKLDDTLQSAKELKKESEDEDVIDRAIHYKSMNKFSGSTYKITIYS